MAVSQDGITTADILFRKFHEIIHTYTILKCVGPMTARISNSLSAIVVLTSMILISTMIVASDDSPAKKPTTENYQPTIEFPDEMVIGKGDDNKAKATVTLTIKLDGVEQATVFKIVFQGTSATAPATILALEAQLEGLIRKKPSPWKYTANYMSKKLIIEGWIDPNTLVYYSVKSITFESAEIPKKYWPKITIPKTRG